MADSPVGLNGLANVNKSPSAGYAHIETGVTVPRMFDSKGRRLANATPVFAPTTNPVQSRSRLPLTQIQFGKMPLHTAYEITNARSGFHHKEATGVQESTNTFWSPMQDAQFQHILSAATTKSSTQGLSPFSSWSALRRKTALTQEALLNDDLREQLCKDPSLLSALSKKLVDDVNFVSSLMAKVKEHAEPAIPTKMTSCALPEITIDASLAEVCNSHGLPRPAAHVAFTTSRNGTLVYEVTITIGHQGKNFYKSQICDNLGDATAQANNRALQALDDIGLRLRGRHDSRAHTHTTSVEDDSRQTEPHPFCRVRFPPRDCQKIPSEGSHAKVKVEESSPEKVGWSSRSTQNGYSDPDAMEVMELVIRDNSQRDIQQPVKTPTPPRCTGSQSNRKRHISSSPLEKPLQLTMTALLALLSLVPVGDAEARVSVICNYLGLDRPIVTQDGPLSQWRASFTTPWLANLSAIGATTTHVYSRLERKIMQRLSEVGIGYFGTLTHDSKRARREGSAAPHMKMLDANRDQETGEREELFTIDSNGDPSLLSAVRHCSTDGGVRISPI